MDNNDRTKVNDFDDYITRYCKMYNYTMEEAEKHAIVREVKESFDNPSQDNHLL